MRILTCFKAVPCWEKVLEADWEHFYPGIDISYAGTAFNCFDESALELALRLKAQASSRGEDVYCAAVTVSKSLPAQLTESLYAAGFDDVIVLSGGCPEVYADTCPEFVPGRVADRLARFAEEDHFDLILTGIEAGMADMGMVPHFLSAQLKLPHVYSVENIELFEDGISVIRRDETGLWLRRIKAPAIISIGNSPAVLRAVSLRARLRAKGLAPRVLRRDDKQCQKPAPSEFSRPQGRRQCAFFEKGSPKRMAERLLGEHLKSSPAKEKSISGNNAAIPKNILAVYFEGAVSEQELIKHWHEKRPDLTLLPNSSRGRELVSRLALQTECAYFTGADIIGFDGCGVIVRKKACASNQHWTARLSFPVAMTISGQMPGNAHAYAAHGNMVGQSWLLDERLLECTVKSSLSTAQTVIVCGMGVGTKEACDNARRLAHELGAGFGLTRPAALCGWGGSDEIVGQSGSCISPKTCLVLGASGAGAFVAGIEDSERIIAVNTNPGALILRHADLGLITDAAALIDALINVLDANGGQQ